jgi:hypothetical protein
MTAPSDDRKPVELLERLIETTQDLFIFLALEAGVRNEQIRGLLRVDRRRISRVSKIRPKKHRTKSADL